MRSVLFALLAACCNAIANVLQRRAAVTIPDTAELRLRLIGYLLRRPVWYVAMTGLLGGFAFQTIALDGGELAVVQPLLVTELPLTLLLAGVVFRRGLGGREWSAVLAMSVGLVLLLLSAAPSGGTIEQPAAAWLLTASVTAAVMAGLVAAGAVSGGSFRGGLFGAAAGVGFGITAAFIKATTTLFGQGLSGVLTSWAPYAMVAAGATSLFLAQNAYQAGQLAVAQPPITILDPLTSIALGVLLFDERLRTGLALVPEIIGAALIAGGTVVLAHSPLVAGDRSASRDGGHAGATPGPRTGPRTGGDD